MGSQGALVQSRVTWGLRADFQPCTSMAAEGLHALGRPLGAALHVGSSPGERTASSLTRFIGPWGRSVPSHLPRPHFPCINLQTALCKGQRKVLPCLISPSSRPGPRDASAGSGSRQRRNETVGKTSRHPITPAPAGARLSSPEPQRLWPNQEEE